MTGVDAVPTARRWTAAEFHDLFHAIKTWERWGPDDQRGALNYLTPARVAAAAQLVRTGRAVSMSLPVDPVAGPDNPHPALHHMTQGYDRPSEDGVQFATDFLGMQFHGDCHTHLDALCHIAYRGVLYGGRSAAAVTSQGASTLDVTAYADGIIGRGVLFDVPRHRAWIGLNLERRSPAPSWKTSRRHRACTWAKATSSCSAPATTAAGSRSAPGTTGTPAPVKRVCMWTP